MIFYFSATGNCKYVAERIAKEKNDKVMSIVEALDKGTNTFRIEEGETVGIISPTYALGIPSIMIDFLSAVKLSYEKKPYCYFVATYGTTSGNAGYFADKYLKSHNGIGFDAFYDVKMPDTWTPIFNLSDSQKVLEINQKAELQINEVINQIQKMPCGNFMKNKIPRITAVVYKPYYGWMRQTKNFTVEDSCIGCNLCAKKCPAKAIEIRDKKPVWTKERCEMCLGCLHRCPKFAIQYGQNTRKHGQYCNPNTTVY